MRETANRTEWRPLFFLLTEIMLSDYLDLCDVECCRHRGRCSTIWVCVPLCLNLKRILSFIVLSSSNQINLDLSLFLTVKIDWKITFDFIFCEKCYQHFTVHREVLFFHFRKTSWPQQHPVSVVLSCSLELPLFCLFNKS